MLKVIKVNSHYGKVQVLREVSLEVKKEEIVCLIGANGAGKSTLLKVICGNVQATSGDIIFMEEKLNGIKSNKLLKRGISRVPEGRKLFGSMTVLENLEMGAYWRKDGKKIKEDVERNCQLFPILATRKNQTAGSMSGGEQQMLAIARGLMASPKLFLLDEPSLGLAPMLVMEIARIVKEINKRGTTTLLVEQNANVALKISHRAYVLETGKITIEGPSSELADNEYVKNAYLGG